MKILIVPDKFKGTLSSKSAADVISQAISSLAPTTTVCKKIAMADGGDGSLAILQGEMPRVSVQTHDALGRISESHYALEGRHAVIESAEIIGLAQIVNEERSPLTASSAGLGEVILDAVARGAREIDIALGGVATSDCGVGMLDKLGFIFTDNQGNSIEPKIAEFNKIASIITTDSYSLLHFRALCDVRNPLLGENGAAAIYAPQKGATHAEVAIIEECARHLTELVGTDSHLAEGSGAAGGLGWALKEFLSADIVSGAELIARQMGLESAIADADLVITGEGRIDQQTDQGKVVSYVRTLCEQHSKPCVIYCGEALTPIDNCYALTDYYTKEEALSNAESLLYSLVIQSIKPYLR